MTNFEYYHDEIANELLKELKVHGCIDYKSYAVTNHNELKFCDDTRCNECMFLGSECSSSFINWLEQEYKEPMILTEFEKALLKRLQEKGFEYIVRDKDGTLYVFDHLKPYKASKEQFKDIWLSNGRCREIIKEIADFYFVKWENEEPIKITDLLGDEDDE